nr:hypothetical protein [uncultured Dysosmobacter sp.]
MNWITAIIGIVISIYLGTVVGVYSVCIETPRLYKAKKYVFYVPFFMIMCIIYGLFSSNRDYRETMIKFLKTPYKCIIILSFFAEVVATERERKPKQTPQKRLVFDGVANLLYDVFQSRKSFYF